MNPRAESNIREVELTPELLRAIGELRYRTWRREGVLDLARFPDGCWVDQWDEAARHWIATTAAGELMGAARLTVHDRLDQSPDGHVWQDHDRCLDGRIAGLSKLVVAPEAQGQWIGSRLNLSRITAANNAGAAWIIATASVKNMRILQGLGFLSAGFDRFYEERPDVPFAALQLELGPVLVAGDIR